MRPLVCSAAILWASLGIYAQIPTQSVLKPMLGGLDKSKEYFGIFEGEVVTRWNDDGRTMTLEKPFAYMDASGFRWSAPQGAVVDGASIPRIAWTIVGGPFEGPYRRASVIHDVACVDRNEHWLKVHRAFYTAMRASKVPTSKAKVMYAAVYHFGPRWRTSETQHQCEIIDGKQVCREVTVELEPPPQTVTEKDFEILAFSIEGREDDVPRPVSGITKKPPISLEEIEAFKGLASLR